MNREKSKKIYIIYLVVHIIEFVCPIGVSLMAFSFGPLI